MEFITSDFLWALVSIIFIDLVLAGDNAIVIGMSARNLPVHQRKKAIFWGTAGAIAIRLVSALAVVWLLKIPALMASGGFLLIWISYKLLVEKKEHDIDAPDSLRNAVKTIVIADGVMGIDNVLGVAGLAHGNIILIALGILITIPIVIWGSTAFITLVERYPAIVYLGGGILAWTAGGMIASDPLLSTHLTAIPHAGKFLSIVTTLAVLVTALVINRNREPQPARN